MNNRRINETTDYGKFEMLPFNRTVEQTKELEKSMMERGFLDEFHINCVRNGKNKLKVREGHHRLYVAKKLNIPVKYMVVDDVISVYEIEKTSRQWSMNDYLVANVKEGRNPYIVVKKYRDRTGIPLSQCIAMLAGETAGSHNKNESFKKGTYSLGDPTHAETVADIVWHLKNACGVKWADNAYLVQAISRVARVSEFSAERFKQKANTHKHFIEKQPNLDAYLEMIETVYNRQSQDKVPLSFLAKQAASKRKKTFGRCESGIPKETAKRFAKMVPDLFSKKAKARA